MGLEAPDHWGAFGGDSNFPDIFGLKMENNYHYLDSYEQSIDNNFVSSHEKFKTDWPKNG